MRNGAVNARDKRLWYCKVRRGRKAWPTWGTNELGDAKEKIRDDCNPGDVSPWAAERAELGMQQRERRLDGGEGDD